MKNHLFLLALLMAGAALANRPVFAQGQDFSKVEIQSTDLGHNMYALAGAGGNITMAVGTDGIIVVDTEFAPLHDKIKAKIASLSPLPVKYILNTHFHGDHTGGNEAFAKEGAIIVAHENVGKRMANPPPGANGQPGTPAPKGALPVQTYAGQGTEVKVAGQAAELVHFENAHTDGDSFVFWPAANVISTGDIVSTASYPNIDVATGGGIDGMIAGADFVIAHADGKTKIVPGHGPVTDKKGVIAYRAMLKTARDRIAAAKKKGLSEDDVANGTLLADLDKKWKPQGSTTPPRFYRLVYQSVK
ncbi:MAG TPA: MBL fold metallo-hydrolase [Rhizomicrobium sp.]|nr:MBL fold metallo-hydrolase [Rhizomicrobium sp.]